MICEICGKKESKQNSHTCGNLICRAKHRLVTDRDSRRRNYTPKRERGVDRALLA